VATSRAVRQVRVIQVSPSGHVTSGLSSFSVANGVPGLGFDYTHLAIINAALHNTRPSNSVRGFRRRQSTLVPILVGGFPYYGDPADYEQPQQQPQVIVIQQPAPAVASQPALDVAYDSAAYAPPQPPAPVRDVGDFILVRRDGRVLFASAYMLTGPQLTYVTPEGIRRTLALADLDADATQQMNEARGTTVQIHN
jgi:hypothetical protein